MAERSLQNIVQSLKSSVQPYEAAAQKLSKAKLLLLQLGALTPTAGKTSPQLIMLARETYEMGALYSIRARNADAFTRYVSLLQPFYELSPLATAGPGANSAAASAALAWRNKVTGLYLLLLLTEGRYAEFHSELEQLANREGGNDVEGDSYLGYPIRLERWLMEGSYDQVWKAMQSREVPCEEYGVFSEVRVGTGVFWSRA